MTLLEIAQLILDWLQVIASPFLEAFATNQFLAITKLAVKKPFVATDGWTLVEQDFSTALPSTQDSYE